MKRKRFYPIAFIFSLLISINLSFGQCLDSVYVPFNGSLPTQGGTWTQNSVFFGDSLRCGSPSIICAYSKQFYVEFNGIGDFLRTPLIPVQATFSFWYRRSTTSATTHRLIVETSPDNVTWTTQLTVTAFTTTYTQVSLSINNVFVRIRDNRTLATDTKLWYLDDVKWTYENKVGVWKGGTSNDWNTATNWCKSTLPTVSDNVIIPSGTPFSPVINSGTASVNDITLNSGATLTNNSTLRIAGTINSTAQINSLNGTIELVRATTQNISGGNFVNKIIGNLKLNSPTIFNIQTDTIKIKNSLSLSTNATLNTNGLLYLLSSDSVTARVDAIPSGARIIGNTTVERFCNYNGTWKLIGFPTTGQTIRASLQEGNVPMGNTKPGYGTIVTSNISNPTSFGFDRYSQNGPSMKYYNSATGSYVDIGNTSNLINTQTGYFLFIRGDRSVTALGMAPNKTILRTTGQLYTPIDNPPPTISIDADKYQSVNNFYASAINFGSLNRTGGVQNAFYLWDPQLTAPTVSAYGLGGYQSFVWDGSNYTPLPGGGSYGSGNSRIESGSAFLVSSVGTSGTLSFIESAKASGNSLVARPKRNSSVRINLSAIINSQPVMFDAALCQFGNFSNDIDKEDIKKLTNNEGISIFRNGVNLIGEFRRSVPNFDTVSIRLNKMKRQQYKFNFIINDLPGVKFSLKDNYLNSSTEVINNSEIVFDVNNDSLSSANDRFELLLHRSNQVRSRPILTVYPNPVSSTLCLSFRNIEVGRYNLTLSNYLGNTITKYTFKYFDNSNSITFILPANLNIGLYRVTLSNNLIDNVSTLFYKK